MVLSNPPETARHVRACLTRISPHSHIDVMMVQARVDRSGTQWDLGPIALGLSVVLAAIPPPMCGHATPRRHLSREVRPGIGPKRVRSLLNADPSSSRGAAGGAGRYQHLRTAVINPADGTVGPRLPTGSISRQSACMETSAVRGPEPVGRGPARPAAAPRTPRRPGSSSRARDISVQETKLESGVTFLHEPVTC